MANRWGNSGKSERLYFGGAPKSLQMVNAAMKFKRCLLLGRKFTTNLDRILKSRDSTLSIKVHLVKAMVFPVVMYGCGSWTIKQAESESEVAHSCTTLWDPMDCSLPGSSVHGIFQARILEWVATAFSKRSSLPRDWTWVFCIEGKFFTIWATREVLATPFRSV